MLPTPTVPDLARSELATLEQKGIKPTLEETAAILYWAHRVEFPDGKVNPLAAGAPVAVGSDLLWPLTIQAELWLELVTRWADPRVVLYATAFACVNGREPDAFADLVPPNAAAAAVENWAAHCPVTADELASAVHRLVPIDRPTDSLPRKSSPSSIDMRDVVADLAVGTGLPHDYWLTQTSDAICRALAALGKHYTAMAGGRFKPRDDATDMLMQLSAVVELAKARHAKEQGESDG